MFSALDWSLYLSGSMGFKMVDFTFDEHISSLDEAHIDFFIDFQIKLLFSESVLQNSFSNEL